MAHSITQTFSKLLNTIGTVADATTKVVDNTAASLDMLDVYVRTAKAKQEARAALDMETFYDDLLKETSLENSMKQHALNTELNSNSEIKALYQTEFSKLETVINRIKAKHNPE